MAIYISLTFFSFFTYNKLLLILRVQITIVLSICVSFTLLLCFFAVFSRCEHIHVQTSFLWHIRVPGIRPWYRMVFCRHTTCSKFHLYGMGCQEPRRSFEEGKLITWPYCNMPMTHSLKTKI